MPFTRLAAALGLAVLADPGTDEDRAVRAVDDLKRDKLAAEQERDAALKRVKELETELAQNKADSEKQRKTALSTQVNGLLDQAYRDGKLLYTRDAESGKALASPREDRLRRIGEKEGVEALTAELAEMPVIAPVNQRILKDDVQQPARASIDIAPALDSVAHQLGLEPKDLQEHAQKIGGGGVRQGKGA